MDLEERFGVKVDLRIPEEDRRYFYEMWEQWLAGTERYAELNPPQ